MKAFITLLSSEDYLEAVLVLNESLKIVNSKYPLVCAITEDLKDNSRIRESLKNAGMYITIIDKLEYGEKTKEKYKNRPVLNTASKISLFKLKRFEKLIYIDADTLVVQNIDNLMNYPDGAMIIESLNDGREEGFTGLFVFQPEYHEEVDLYEILLKESVCFDGDLLGKLWFYVKTSSTHQISETYCYPFTKYSRYSLNLSDIKVLHFINDKKPWMNKNSEDKSENSANDSEKEALNLYNEILNKVKKYLDKN